MEGFDGGQFDHIFGTKIISQSVESGNLSNLDTRANSFGGIDVLESGRHVASTVNDPLGKSHITYSKGMQVSSTSTDPFGNTQIHGSIGEDIGVIKQAFYGDGNELYIDGKLAAHSEVDVSGNKKIMALEDPLIKAHQYALVELMLSE